MVVCKFEQHVFQQASLASHNKGATAILQVMHQPAECPSDEAFPLLRSSTRSSKAEVHYLWYSHQKLYNRILVTRVTQVGQSKKTLQETFTPLTTTLVMTCTYQWCIVKDFLLMIIAQAFMSIQE